MRKPRSSSSGLTQIRQARANQLTRVVTNFSQIYGAKDPRTVAAQTLAHRRTDVLYAPGPGAEHHCDSPPPTAPANGWVIYGKVLNSDGSAASQLTVFLADSTRAWLQQYAYAFTDQTGYYTLTSAPSAEAASSGRKTHRVAAAAALSAYLQISNAACKLMFVDAAPMSIFTGAAIRRDIRLSAQGSVGAPPCDSAAPSQTPPAKQTPAKP